MINSNQTAKQTIDEEQARELYLFAINDGELYRQTVEPSIKMLQRKIIKRIFNKDLAIQYYSNTFARIAMDKYKKEVGSIGGRVNQATKNAFGAMMYDSLKEQIFLINNEVNA